MDAPGTGSEILDRAIASLRDTRPPDEPSQLTIQRTVAALWAAELRAERSRSRWILRIAAAIVLGVCAAATMLVLDARRQYRTVVMTPPQTHVAVPRATPAPGPRDPQTPHQTTAHTESHISAPEPSDNSTAPPAAFASEVRITGHVYYDGPPVPRRPIDLSSCPQCLHTLPGPIYDDSLLVNEDGTIQNVVVSIAAAPANDSHSTTPGPVLLDQKYCTFEPHVVVAMVGQQMMVRNSDMLLHSTHATNSTAAPTFNFALPGISQRMLDPFRTTDTFEVNCDLHPWMHAWVRVLANPYFDVTRGAGIFAIKDLSPGTYRITAWHESLGTQEKQVRVTGGEPVVVDFTFEAAERDK